MTATEELRRLLDERGVEWKNETAFMQGQEHLMTTWRSADDKTVAYSEFEYPHMRKLRIYDCTPEQAIAATLGSGTCHDSNKRFNAWQCSECGATLLLMFDDFGEPSLSVDGVADVPHFCPNCGRRVE